MRTVLMVAIALAGCSPANDKGDGGGFDCTSPEGRAAEISFTDPAGTNLNRPGFGADSATTEANAGGAPYRLAVTTMEGTTKIALEVFLPAAPRIRTTYPVVFWAQAGTSLPDGSVALEYRETPASALPTRWWSSGGGELTVSCSTPRSDMPGYAIAVLSFANLAMQAVPGTISTGTFKATGRLKAAAAVTP